MDRSLEDNMPIYMQIMNSIRDAIASGELAAGDKVPSVREFASEFEVNPNTMQRALMELEREGILVSERAIGRFVTDDRSRIDAMRREAGSRAADAFIRQMADLGFSEEEMLDFFRERYGETLRKQVG
ncbi:MAG: GntR family transcriptional regulator [Eubacteriales bacterium]|nr:GntR family transcriptional regulator [Eubacteriales bacterium]MDY2933401.1 GntR family transcriptional regulator [Anaerovoracaceae bacterium]